MFPSHTFILAVIIIQGITDDYGIDWTGPVPVEDVDNVVRVDDLTDVLSDAEKATLMQQITQPDTLTEEWMIHSFSVAKLFVHAAATN